MLKPLIAHFTWLPVPRSASLANTKRCQVFTDASELMFLIQLRVLLQDNCNCLTHTQPFPSSHYTSMIRECIDSRVPMKCCKMKVTQGCIHLHTSTELCNTHGSSAVAQGTRGLKGISTPIYRFGAKWSLSLFGDCKIWEEKKDPPGKIQQFPQY